MYLWYDARVVLDWLNSPKISSTLVHRRVVAIRSLCANAHLRHISTSLNPADIITRNVSSVEKFINNNFWWQGPSFLSEPKDQWPKEEYVYSLSPPFKEPLFTDLNSAFMNSVQVIESSHVEVSVDTPLKLRNVESSFFDKYFSDFVGFNVSIVCLSLISKILFC